MAFAAAALRASQISIHSATVARLRSSVLCNPMQRVGLLQSSFADLGGVRTMAARADSGDQQPRVYTNFTIYKGKAALALRPGRATFKHLENENSYAMTREGSVFLEFANASGPRRYDWEKKQVFALSPLEMATLMDLSDTGAVDFTHDPNKGKEGEGKVIKRMNVSPLSSKDGFYFGLTVKDDIQKTNAQVGVPVSRGEFAVIKSIFNYLIPHLLGWGVLVDPTRMGSVLVENGFGDGAPDKVLAPEDR